MLVPHLLNNFIKGLKQCFFCSSTVRWPHRASALMLVMAYIDSYLPVGLLSLFLPYCLRRVLGSRSLLVVYIFTSTKSPRGPPWNEGHRPKVRHETSVFEVPVQEQHEHSFFSSSTNTFITGSLYTVHRYCTSPGAPDLRARLG